MKYFTLVFAILLLFVSGCSSFQNRLAKDGEAADSIYTTWSEGRISFRKTDPNTYLISASTTDPNLVEKLESEVERRARIVAAGRPYQLSGKQKILHAPDIPGQDANSPKEIIIFEKLTVN